MIQIDMPMPNNCLDCQFCNEYWMCEIPVNGRKWGENDVREFSQSRPEWCPLKEQEPVVRCKDCKKKGSYLCRLDRDLQEYGGHRTDEYDDWFCADGERW